MADRQLCEETEKRLRSNKGVIGFLVIDGDGIALRSTMGDGDTVHYAALVSRFVAKSRCCVRKLAEDDELQMVRLRSQKHEITVASDYGVSHEYHMVVVQDPTVA